MPREYVFTNNLSTLHTCHIERIAYDGEAVTVGPASASSEHGWQYHVQHAEVVVGRGEVQACYPISTMHMGGEDVLDQCHFARPARANESTVLVTRQARQFPTPYTADLYCPTIPTQVAMG